MQVELNQTVVNLLLRVWHFEKVLSSSEYFKCLDNWYNLREDDPRHFGRRVSWFPCLGDDMQHHLVTRQSSWLPTNALQTEAMCLLTYLWVTAPCCLRIRSLFTLFPAFCHIFRSIVFWSSLFCKQTIFVDLFLNFPLLPDEFQLSLSVFLACFPRDPEASMTSPVDEWLCFQCLMNEEKQMLTI